MTEQPVAPALPTEQYFGIAKKIALELEKHAIHSHAGIVMMLNGALEHRQLTEKLARAKEEAESQAKITEANQQAMAETIAAHQRDLAKREKNLAERMKAIGLTNEPTMEQRAEAAGIALVNG
jgi:hypothetical protein